MKRTKRIGCLILALLLVFFACTSASASTRASDYLRSYLAYCYAEEDGSISAWFEVIGNGRQEALGVLTIMIEEKAPGGSWEHAKTYTNFDTPELLSYDDDFHYGHVDYDEAIPGYSYRAYITFWGGGMEIGDARYYMTTAVTALNPSN